MNRSVPFSPYLATPIRVKHPSDSLSTSTRAKRFVMNAAIQGNCGLMSKDTLVGIDNELLEEALDTDRLEKSLLNIFDFFSSLPSLVVEADDDVKVAAT